MRACARWWMHASASVLARVWVHDAGLFLRACSLTYPARNAHAQYCLQSLAPPCFSSVSHKRHEFRGRVTEYEIMFWFSLQLLFETFLILRRIQRDIVINLKTSSCKTRLVLVGFQLNFNFLYIFSKKDQISNLIKILEVGADFFSADGRTDE